MNYIKKMFTRELGIVGELGKIRITLFVAFSTSIGYVLAAKSLSWTLLFISAGVFLLAAGASALNHVQEKDTDKLMTRTSARPLPSGRIGIAQASLYSIILLAAGSTVIFLSAGIIACSLGIFAVIWYNLVYTLLKRKTSLAIIPGSIIGAIPPVIGWIAAGGNLLNPEIMALAFFFFIWQIPHFWLLQLVYNDEYESAGFPTLSRILDLEQIRRITFIWIMALTISCLFIPMFSFTSNSSTLIALIIIGTLLLWRTRDLLKKYVEQFLYRRVFINLNLYVLLVVIFLSFEKLLTVYQVF